MKLVSALGRRVKVSLGRVFRESGLGKSIIEI